MRAAGALPAKAVAVRPAPGVVLTSGPRAVTVHFPASPAPPVQLQVLDTRGDERAGPVGVRGTVAQVAVAAMAPGTYTVLWSTGQAQGASTFTVWRGGPLPPSLARAAYGGATAVPPGFWLDLWTTVALAGALFFLGGAAGVGGAPRHGTARRGALSLIAGAVSAALERVALAADAGFPRLLRSPLFPALVGRGVALDGLLAAAVALLGLVALPRRRPLAIGAAALTLGLLVATLPPLRTGALLPAWAAAAGLALAAGGLPGLSRRRTQEARTATRWIGAALAASGGVVLFLRVVAAGPALSAGPLPLAAGLGTLAGLIALACAVLPRPPRGAAACGALSLVVAAAAFSPVLTRPAPGVRGALTLRGNGTPGVSVSSGGVTLRLSSARAGANTVEVLDGRTDTPLLPLTISLVGGPRVSGTVGAVRMAAGVYAAATTAFSVPGTWRVTVAGRTLAVRVGGNSLGACRSFPGRAARWAALGGPVLALTAAPGAPDTALAATARGVFATSNGGRTWTLAGDPGRTTALAVDRYGQWWAATPAGLRTSQNGGVSWLPVPGLKGAAGAVFTPVYPSGVPLWAVVGGSLFERTWQTTFTGLQTTWGLAATVPAGAALFTAVPPAVPQAGQAGAARWQGQPVSLLAGGPGGLWQSTSGSASWARVLSAPVRDVAVGAGALWAAGPDGLYAAAHAAGPWRAVQGLGGATAVAVGGPSGGTLFAARPGAGLLRSTDGGRTWTSAGCPVGTVTLLAGTYERGRPAPLSPEPVVYLADARGDVVAVMPGS